MRILLIGYGKMGQTIERLALAKGHEIVGALTVEEAGRLASFTSDQVDVAIEFTSPHAALGNILTCIKNKIPVVVGTTGWLQHLPQIEEKCQELQGTLFYASNFSVGVNLFFHFNEYVAQKMQQYPEYGVQVKEIHHVHKLDKPSGTALSIADGILKHFPQKQGWVNEVTVAPELLGVISEREGEVVGTHIVQYTSENDTFELHHIAHSREGFASGALLAAEWLPGRTGIFGMNDLLQL
ncbi:4-hydroxy-tetrahydrodipicolinate reductase [Rufibacter glacialis]|uniref:4-hydroxy-tetrahydrodipicolinate reductase n=1 Tax=Rufibacter glacialis TaxID=1259555 RepID=A0A5M8QJP5_9BACT|nr:4-hydroxy-tetrahydrodipicolinate reductase [Rufibacter glacialis]KAA6434552.1 4-hydroxy-tetrahydrodipicolinate reductase [Rufibacter glacialis]GGK70594.1 4-hydroxy-tetrahydrodipicolinate reductase [Rufibacter glacialis]